MYEAQVWNYEEDTNENKELLNELIEHIGKYKKLLIVYNTAVDKSHVLVLAHGDITDKEIKIAEEAAEFLNKKVEELQNANII